MMMVASSVVLTVVVLNYHHRTAETHNMPAWVRKMHHERMSKLLQIYWVSQKSVVFWTLTSLLLEVL